jgi:2-haloalkanoic acid dehalogenase type II
MANQQPPIRMIAFDMYGTLVQNGMDLWMITFEEIIQEQRLPISTADLWREWRSREVSFRSTRTVMHDPLLSPPFRTYYEAWRDAFTDTFRDVGLDGDAEDAAHRCTRDQGTRPAFADAAIAIPKLAQNWPLGLLSNADHGYLLRLIERHDWPFGTTVSSESAQAYKPDPRIFEGFCGEAGVDPEEVLYVGDAPYDDVHGAKAAGMTMALLIREQDTPGRTPEPGAQQLQEPDFRITSLLELETALQTYVRPA